MSEKNKKKKYPGISAIFWIVFALILLILFLVNKNRIFSVLQTTGFFSKVFGTEPEFIANLPSADENKPVAELESVQGKTTTVEIETKQSPIILTAISGDNKTTSSDSAQTGNSDGKTSGTQQTQGQSAEKKDQVTQNTLNNTSAATANSNIASAISPVTGNSGANTASTGADVSDTSAQTAASQMKQYLFFIQIDGDGSILRKESVRTIPKTTTPLTVAITALLDGPNLDEIEKGYISLIPQGTKLLGASVKNGTATINFNDSFRYNQYGVEGYYGQLMQIVYTATAFSNIDNVQFLIEGEKMDYLGLEGVFIGAPLSIASFH